MKVLLRTPNWIGDCVMMIPALKSLNNKGKYKIDLILRENLIPIFQGFDFINDFILLPKKMGMKNLIKYSREIRKRKYDYGLLFTNSFNSALLFKLGGIKEIIGYNRDMRGFLLDKKLDFKKWVKGHYYDFYLNIVESFLGEKIEREDLEIPITSEEKERLIDKLKNIGVNINKMIGISAFSSYGESKNWVYYKDLIKKINYEFKDYDIVLFGSEQEFEKNNQFVLSERVFNLCGKLNLRESIIAISLLNLFIGNDSGLLHISSVFKIPSIGIFGPTNPKNSAPINNNLKIIFKNADCSPCKYRICPYEHKCMKEISLNQVFEVVKNKIT